ncbi:MAG: ADP-ribosylation factor-like protein [Candidatus Hodarchaeales archaeon]|jgi:small GTP-binding protein
MLEKEFQFNVVVAGLANAGKTSILQRLKTGKFVSPRATRGVHTETIEKENVEFLVFDLGGHKTYIQTLWRTFLQKVDTLIYVVDANDKENVEKARNVLKMAISWNPSIRHLLILANKQDVFSAANEIEILEKFELSRILANTRVKESQIFGTSAKMGTGIENAFNWLASELTCQKIVPRVDIKSVFIYKELDSTDLSSQDLYSELVHMDLSMDRNNVSLVSDFYNTMGANKTLARRIKKLEITGINGEIINLVNVEKNNFFCILVIDPEDDLVTLEAISNELLDYAIKREKNKQYVDQEKIRDIISNFS